MNRLFIIIPIVFFISCNDVAEKRNIPQLLENSKAVQVQLVDSLGMVNFSVPLRYDTSFSWINYSDCGKPCDFQEYRYQSKGLPITKESGWFWNGESKDSVDNFTISHTSYIPFHEGDTQKVFTLHGILKRKLTSEFEIPRNPPITFDTIEKVNDRYFSFFAMEKSDSVYLRKVIAITTIKNNEIRFQYKLLTNKNDSTTKNFIKNSIALIKTIKISKGL
jgi:hypothetical protein